MRTHLAARTALVAAIAVGTVAVVAAPAQAAQYKADGKIKVDAPGPYLGNNVYNNSGSQQTAAGNDDPGGKVTYLIKAQNDGNKADRLIINSNQASNQFTYKFKAGGANLTNQIVSPGSGYKTPLLQHKGTFELTLVVKIGSGAALVQQDLANIEIDSAKDGNTVVDKVIAKTDVTG